MKLFESDGVIYQGQAVMLRNVSGRFMEDQMRPAYKSVHLQRQLELARAWLAQSRVPVSVRCGMAERLFLASREKPHDERE